MLITLLYYLLAGLVAASAVFILITPHLLYAALGLMITIMGLAAIYFLQGAAFIAVAHIILYVGGVLLIILFSLMLFNPSINSTSRRAKPGLTAYVIILLMLGLASFFYIGIQILPQPSPAQRLLPAKDAVAALGLELFGPYALVLELAGIILLIALIGALYIARGSYVDQNSPQT